ncbi:MAG: hypothetical protein QNJ32_10865 [Xenococcaceae cyanobacterium MO_167.B27]|nr:hypothetical protein [Xenococcaceae cyanobacterium MO_167.B27]
MYGRAGNDTLTGGGGHDTLFGETGADELHGGRSGDWLIGGDGGDELHGGRGRDTLIGGDGKDELHGGHGHDVFVLDAGEGTDTIADFSLDADKIGLSESGGLTFNDLDFEGHSIIFDGETLATLTGVNTTSLTSDHFVIV